ncbi:two-component regulator propeller domain-containing protein [Mesonia sp. K7]|uniref:type IX secretion system anionic LPS delivery protein PorZ n=1 Tax=Mesonia sp. K7 TaxID=2218606 RepID=UPI001314174B|nr:two-component regulator propeller domain-containing protein [Mesonia sp. K7]
MKKVLLLLLVFFPFWGISQDYSTQWEDMFSYYNIQDVSLGSQKIYAAAENSVFSFSKISNQTEKISSIQGLSSEKISKIHFSRAYNLLFVGYESGLIDIYNPQDKSVLTVIDIVEKVTITPENKMINHFYEDENLLYIATNYGISVFRLNNLEFGDSYFIGDNASQIKVNQITVNQSRIYTATEFGIKTAEKDNPNLIDYNVWQTIDPNTFYKGIVTLENQMIVVDDDNNISRFNGNAFTFVENFNTNVRSFKSAGSFLTVCGVNKVKVYNSQVSTFINLNNFPDFEESFNTAIFDLQTTFIGDSTLGLLRHNPEGTEPYSFLSPDGPVMNRIFNTKAIPNELWITHGEYDITLNPYPLNQRGVSHYKNEEWQNVDYKQLDEKKEISRIAINPANTNQVFLSCFYDGLIEILEGQLLMVYDETNTQMPETVDSNGDVIVQGDVRINGIGFDRQGNLWGNISMVKNGLFKFNSSSISFQFFDITEIIPDFNGANLGFTDLVVDNIGNVFFGSYREGVVGYNSNSNTFGKVTENIPETYVRSLALDNNNQLWIGSSRGLRVLYGPSAMFNDPNLSASEIVILDEDGVPQELLRDASISDITVDGNNNKWIATDAGAFYLSSNGQETIYRFTKENSPLPSNSVSSIEVDEASGKVYIGTINGLVAFRGTATSGNETFEQVRAFPNPVRPNYTGMVTIDGLREGANVKITDITGNLVYEVTAQGGSIQWDTTAFGRHKVASGVYMVMLTSEDQLETKITKIMIIR